MKHVYVLLEILEKFLAKKIVLIFEIAASSFIIFVVSSYFGLMFKFMRPFIFLSFIVMFTSIVLIIMKFRMGYIKDYVRSKM
jgi:hypothetical protein